MKKLNIPKFFLCQVGGVAVLGMLLVLVFVPLTREPPQFFMVLSSAILFTVIALHSLLGGSPILWILYNIIRDELTVSYPYIKKIRIFYKL